MGLEEEVGTTLGDMKKRTLLNIGYNHMDRFTWDHSVSSVKVRTYYLTIQIQCVSSVCCWSGVGRSEAIPTPLRPAPTTTSLGPQPHPTPPTTSQMSLSGVETGLQVLIVEVENSLELEAEFKMRFKGLVKAAQAEQRQPPRTPPFEYVGMYAGPTKPKPFQRKRANLSNRETGKLPSLAVMRQLAVSSHQGSGKPTSSQLSRRMQLAKEHWHCGCQTFELKGLEGLDQVSTARV